MSVKSVLGKIGKVALTAAPYVAAPFTGGASLLATGLANKAVQKWSEHDAKDAIAHGLAPSKFDSVLGKAGTIGSLATAFMPTNALGAVGMLGSAGKAASTAAKVGGAAKTASVLGKAADTASKTAKTVGILNKVSKVADIAGPAIGAVAAMKSNKPTSGIGPSNGVAIPRPSTAGNAPGFQYGTNNPNLADALSSGRLAAARDQGFRRGYDVTTRFGEPDEAGNYQTTTTRMPRIHTDYASMGIQPPMRRKKTLLNEDGSAKYQPAGRAGATY